MHYHLKLSLSTLKAARCKPQRDVAPVPNSPAKCVQCPYHLRSYAVYYPCEDPAAALQKSLDCVNQRVCHHLVIKKPPHLLEAYFAYLNAFYDVPSIDEQPMEFWFCSEILDMKASWNQPTGKSGDLFCLHALPHFASSYWSVITNLKNIADVRYDHASSVSQWAGLWDKRVRPCVMPCQKTPNMKVSLCVSGRRQKLSPRVRVRVGMCVIKPRYSAA